MTIRPRALAGAAIAALASVLVLSACGSSSEPAASTSAGGDAGALTVYSGREEEYMEPVFDAFEKKTGTTLDVRYGDSADLALLVGEEGDKTPADVFISQSPISQSYLDQKQLLSQLPQAVLDRVPANLRAADGDWIGIAGRQRVLMYNTDLVKPADLPKSVLDLTDPKYKGKVAVAPSNASFQDFVAALNQIEGKDATNAWLAGMAENGARSYAKNSAIAEAVVLNPLGDLLLCRDVGRLLGDALEGGHIHTVGRVALHQFTRRWRQFDALDAHLDHIESEPGDPCAER